MKKRKKRDYKKEYKQFHGTKKQKRLRGMRNKARIIMGLKVGDKREVHHVYPLSKCSKNGNRKSNLRVVSRRYNRKKGNKI